MKESALEKKNLDIEEKYLISHRDNIQPKPRLPLPPYPLLPLPHLQFEERHRYRRVHLKMLAISMGRRQVSPHAASTERLKPRNSPLATAQPMVADPLRGAAPVRDSGRPQGSTRNVTKSRPPGSPRQSATASSFGIRGLSLWN